MAQTNRCVGVLGSSGGVGATVLAAVAASRAPGPPATLIDLDPASGGVHVTLGFDTQRSLRWSGIHTAGGELDPAELALALPRWNSVAVLTCDLADLEPDPVSAVLAAAGACGPVVVDLGRGVGSAARTALARCDTVALIVRASVPGVAAAAHTMDLLAADTDVRVLIAERESALSARAVRRALGVGRVARLPADAGLQAAATVGPQLRALRRSTRALVDQLWTPPASAATAAVAA